VGGGRGGGGGGSGQGLAFCRNIDDSKFQVCKWRRDRTSKAEGAWTAATVVIHTGVESAIFRARRDGAGLIFATGDVPDWERVLEAMR